MPHGACCAWPASVPCGAGWARGRMPGVHCLLAAIRCEKGEVTGNLAAHLEGVAEAASAGCQLAVFPEMSLTGSADPAAAPDRLIGLDHPAVGRLAGRGPCSRRRQSLRGIRATAACVRPAWAAR